MIDRDRSPRPPRLLAALALSLLLAGRAAADITVEIQPTAIDASTTNTFEVDIVSTVDQTLSAFSISLAVDNGVTLTNATESGSYVFSGVSLGLFLSSNPDNISDIAVDSNLNVTSVTLDANQTYSLGVITFDASGASPGTYDVNIANTSSLTDGGGNPLGITNVINGQITVASTTYTPPPPPPPPPLGTPEPSTAILPTFFLTAVAASWIRRRRAAA